jgi:peptidyl-prolyl cis-trans isomerase SurA
MRHLFWVAALFISVRASSQTLLIYGNDSVPVSQFLQALNKNDTGLKTPAALKDYLDLYIASRLKIKEAQSRRYDTLPQLLSDIENLRTQILPVYEKDAETIKALTEEAFTRSQKDIRIRHIFIAFKDENGMWDTATAARKAAEVMTQIKSKASFSDLAKKYSNDPSARDNGGDLGYITVFSLPYQLENLAYATAPGSVSALYRSNKGYHIFKNEGERKALGRVKSSQILISFPPESTEGERAAAKRLADSLYARILKGDDFGKLALNFSNDAFSSSANGQLPEFGVGEYDPVFESAVYQLKVGKTSNPFLTKYGYHIVRKDSETPVASAKTDGLMLALKEKTEQSDRIDVSKSVLIKKVIGQAGYKKLAFDDQGLWQYSDSVFGKEQKTRFAAIKPATPLFTVGSDTTLVDDWISFAQTARYGNDGSGIKPYQEVWEEFVQSAAMKYYLRHLDYFNRDFKNQMAEFREGNLFFEIMQREIWGPAQSDTVALKAYYQKNKQRYQWTKSAGAVIFYTSDLTTAQQMVAQLKKSALNWKELAASMSDKVTTDSGRFEINQIPNPGKLTLKKGMITEPVLNKGDNTASFAYIMQLFEKPAQRSFEEAKALVVNDYQNDLEARWMQVLQKKYPVTINQSVWSALVNSVKK